MATSTFILGWSKSFWTIQIQVPKTWANLNYEITKSEQRFLAKQTIIKHFRPVKTRVIVGHSKFGYLIICPYQVKDCSSTNRPQMTTDHHGRPQMTTDHHGRPQMTTDDHHLECKNSQNGVILVRSKLGSFLGPYSQKLIRR